LKPFYSTTCGIDLPAFNEWLPIEMLRTQCIEELHAERKKSFGS